MRHAVPLLMILAACDPDPAFFEPIDHPRAAFMSVGGSGPDDVWIVGAQPSPLEPAVVLRRRDGGAWRSVDTGALHPIWWVHGFEGGPTFLGGGGGTVLRVDGDAVTRTPTPPFFGNTVFGVWGAAPDDVWAVGGFAGRDGFVWRYDGQAWTALELPDDLPRARDGEIPSLFKVWGRSSTDVWIVGGLGTVLHYDGDALRVVPSPTDRPLFTVTGNANEVFIVGGDARGVVLRGGLGGLVDDTPVGAPLLQGVTVDAKGRPWIAGAGGYAARLKGARWREVDLGMSEQPQSVHALWSDGSGNIWGAGGGVLSANLDEGVVCSTEVGSPVWEAPPAPQPPTTCPADKVDPIPDGTIARRWAEQLLNSIRRDIPHPPKHARNIHHVSAAMYDAWAAYQAAPTGFLVREKHEPSSPSDVDVAISYAALRVLEHRYETAVGAAISLDCYDGFMGALGLDPADTRSTGDDPVAVGNRIGFEYVAYFADDGANEGANYADTTAWAPSNPVMFVDRPGTNATNPDVWQQLNLGVAETQNGIILDDAVQPYIGAHWRDVEPFALARDPDTGRYSVMPTDPPSLSDPRIVDQAVQVIARTAELTVEDGVMVDAGPFGRGNNPLGSDDGTGYPVNPKTGRPYAPNPALRGDFTRVVAEMWADGPASETPPGHWLRLSLEVSEDLPDSALVPFGDGGAVDRLAWDVGLYFTLGGAVHDAAISAWELKRDLLGPRPITLIRYLAQKGQRSDPALPSFDPQGIPLVPGLIELVTAESAAPGGRHRHLKHHIGEIAVWSWPGEPGDRVNEYTPLQWMRGKDWIPYQRRTFVTPAFPGFTSGHSTFSRAAAEAMTEYTADPFFPGGLKTWTAPRNGYLKFEAGPTADLTLQWATYQDAADQSGQSRIWGGIHIFEDDWVGRVNGYRAGLIAADHARALYQGTAP
jgi:hypothetical protein